VSLRLLEILVPAPSEGAIQNVLEEHGTLGAWSTELPDDRVRVSALVRGETAQPLMDALDERVADITDARVLLLSVQATLPRPEEIEAEEAAKEGDPEASEESSSGSGRLSTAELYQDVLGMSRTTKAYVALVLLSTVVAAIGMLHNSIIVIIGAMVIAPLIGPNVGLALATTLADGRLAKESLGASVVGIGAALAASLALGFALPSDPAAPVNEIPQIADRTTVALSDLGLALAAGAAAVLSLTIGVSTALVGVMVAVALLPPIVAVGVLWGAGYTGGAVGAALLTAVNVICVNLAGVVTFLVQGVRPNEYWEAAQARRSTVIALLIWTVLLGVLLFLILRVFGLQNVLA